VTPAGPAVEHAPPLAPPPADGRVFRARRPVRLSDRDVRGRLRLDAVARYLQDVAGDDVDETGWGAPEHLWVVRWYRIAVVRPFLRDRRVELTTWCSALAPAAAGRRTTLLGDAGGHAEADSAWVHLDRDARPARLAGFEVYGASTEGRRTSTRLVLPDPPADALRSPWQLRVTDVDLMGHLNNAVHWGAVEDVLAASELDPGGPLDARLEYRAAIDLGDEVELACAADGSRADVAFLVDGSPRAVARVERTKER
jgi:acyl-ACP thioesterase